MRPLLIGVPHAAGRIDAGSEVIGFDTAMSADHDWGADRLQIFVADGSPRSNELNEEVNVTSTHEFFLEYLSFDLGEKLTAADWLSFPEQKLLTVSTGNLAARLIEQISDSGVRALAAKGLIGGIDVFCDSTDLVSHSSWRTSVKRLYD